MEFGLMDAVVGAAVLFAIIFFVAWLVSPALRTWIERPKYGFQRNVKSYDESRAAK